MEKEMETLTGVIEELDSRVEQLTLDLGYTRTALRENTEELKSLRNSIENLIDVMSSQ